MATGTPFKNLTEYSKISPAEELATLPLDKSIIENLSQQHHQKYL